MEASFRLRSVSRVRSRLRVPSFALLLVPYSRQL